MSEIGEIRKAKEIGRKGNQNAKYIWILCPDCYNERWVKFIKGSSKYRSCQRCLNKKTGMARRGRDIGEHNSHWKGGRNINNQGYVLVWLPPNDDFFRPMTNNYGYVLEHRLVIAKYLGRCLQKWEQVHHKNGVKDDNQIENLELTTNGAHHVSHSKGYKDGYQKGIVDGRDKRIDVLQQRVTILEAELAILHIRDLSELADLANA